MTNEAGFVGGMDSHKDTVHVAVITETGRGVDDHGVPHHPGRIPGSGGLADRPRELEAVGIEGTSSYGTGISAALTDAAVKRHGGQPDPTGRATQAGQERPAGRLPRSPGRDGRRSEHRTQAGIIEPLRALNIARRSALKARQAALRQIGALLINAAPPCCGTGTADMPVAKLVAALATTRPAAHRSGPGRHHVRAAVPARRHRDLDEEIDAAEHGCGPGPPRPTRPAGHQRHRAGHRRAAAHHRRRQPRPAACEASFAALCAPPRPGQLRTHRPAPALSRR